MLNVIQSLPIKSVIDFAANQGKFSAMLAETPEIEKIVALDYDENAVDIMYNLLSRNYLSNNCVRKIFPMVANFSKDIEAGHVNSRSLCERIKSDAAVILAMTHHLLLGQYIRIQDMFRTFSRFTNRFILIEFMPLGLWSGGAVPPVPAWYTEKTFVEHMEKYFKILLRQQTATNRILFVGELKN